MTPTRMGSYFLSHFIMSPLASIPIYLGIVFLSIVIMYGWGTIGLKYFLFNNKPHFFSSPVLFGFIILSTFIEIFHFFFPIDWKLSLLVIILGFIFLYLNIAEFLSFFEKAIKWIKSNLFIFLSLTIVAVYWCLRVTKASTNYDTAAYHLQTIRWINEFALIPGLGNLWGHLAYNQSYFEFLALLKFFPFFNEGFVLGGLMFFIITWIVLLERQLFPYINYAFFAFILYLGTHSAGSTIFSPTPDLIVGFFEIIIFAFFLNYLYEKNNYIKHREIIPLLLLSLSYLFTLKLSAVVFAFTLFISILLILIKDSNLKNIYYFKLLFLSGFICFIHVINSYVMTGMPMYPSSFARIGEFSWAVSLNQANQEVLDIYRVTRRLDILPSDSSWFLVWLKNLTLVNWIYIISSLLLTIKNLHLIMTKQFVRVETFSLLLFCISIFSAIVFWFYQAPDFRYLCALFEIYISGSLLLFLTFTTEKSIFLKSIYVSNKFVIYISGFLVAAVILSFNPLLISPLKEIILTPNITKQRTPSGIPINIPEGLCWDSPLPCVYEYDKNLKLIDSNDISSGFKIQP